MAPEKQRAFPYLIFVVLYYIFFYGIAPLAVPILRNQYGLNRYFDAFPQHVDGKVISFVFLFFLIFTGMYLLGIRFFKRGNGKEPAHSYDHSGLLLLAVSSIILHFVIKVGPDLAIPGLNQLIEPLWYFGFSVLSLFLFQGKLGRSLLIFYGIALTFNVAVGIWGGLLTPLFMSVAILASISLFLRRYKHFMLLTSVVVLGLSTYGYFKTFYRTQIAVFPMETLSDPYPSFLASLASVVRRSTHLHLLQNVANQTPSQIPYWDAKPVLRAALNHIPRIIQPNKPLENLGNRFGKTYGILSPTDNTTSWNVPWIVDFYRVGGFTTALIYGAITGFLIGIGVGFMSTRKNRAFWFGVYSASIFPLFFQDSNFSLMTGSVFWVVLILFLGIKTADSFVVFLKRKNVNFSLPN